VTDAAGRLVVHERCEHAHDRHERRRVAVLPRPPTAPAFPGLVAVGRIEAERTLAGGARETQPFSCPAARAGAPGVSPTRGKGRNLRKLGGRPGRRAAGGTGRNLEAPNSTSAPAAAIIPVMSKDRLNHFQVDPRRRRPRDTFDPDCSYDMANLYPDTTGLPHTVYVSPRNASHDIRIKVCTVPGKRMLADQTVSVGLRPTVHEVGDKPQLPRDVMEKVTEWANLNKQALQDYWDGTIDTMGLATRLQKLP
jgi:hypothetical protein